MTQRLAPSITIGAVLLYWTMVAMQDVTSATRHERPAAVVMTGPVQIVMYAGDRFLAANIEAIRASAASTDLEAHDFRARAHQIVSRLNPCHEDNYWIGNAALSWGGAEDQGFELLRNTMRCRFWDEWPAFFYGFNQHFFRQDVLEARRALEEAAERSPKNAATFRTFATMLAAGEIHDTRAALEMVQRERDQAKDPNLREMLDERVIRLQGLLLLRDAQAEFERRFGKPLNDPQELLESGLLEAFPYDPLRLGYEFRDQSFHLRQLKIE